LEQCTNSPCLPIQGREGQIRSLYLSIDQVSIDPLLWLLERPPAKKFDESRNFANSTDICSIHLQLCGELATPMFVIYFVDPHAQRGTALGEQPDVRAQIGPSAR
jgi:hypothetical protein